VLQCRSCLHLEQNPLADVKAAARLACVFGLGLRSVQLCCMGVHVQALVVSLSDCLTAEVSCGPCVKCASAEAAQLCLAAG
jgi:hypothetical protein